MQLAAAADVLKLVTRCQLVGLLRNYLVGLPGVLDDLGGLVGWVGLSAGTLVELHVPNTANLVSCRLVLEQHFLEWKPKVQIIYYLVHVQLILRIKEVLNEF